MVFGIIPRFLLQATKHVKPVTVETCLTANASSLMDMALHA